MTLTIDLDCFPFDLRPYRLKSECINDKLGIGRLTE
jgi:hypothetical protein